ncbi:MAG TPA: hypothetical protein VGM54_13195 [Chthoniobacter sp.]|jgi:hypothetical protein
MQVQSTLNFPNGTCLTIESPNVVGETDMARLARILEGEVAQKVYGNNLRLPPGFGPETRGEFVAIAIDDAPLGERWHSTRVLVTEWPLLAPIVGGVILQRDDGQWVAYSGIYDDLSAAKAPALLVREPWVLLLARLVKNELEQYLRLAWQLNRVTDAWIVREVQSRCVLFNDQDLVGFFQGDFSFVLWQIGTRWPQWEERGLPAEERLHELVESDPTVKLGIGEFLRLCEENGLAIENGTGRRLPSRRRRPTPPWLKRTPPVELFTPLRGNTASTIRHISEFRDDEELKTIFMAGSYPQVGPDSPLSEREHALVRDWSPEADAIFSYGGDPELNFDTDPELWSSFPPKAEGITLEDLLNHVWWWKSCVDDFAPATASIIEGPSERKAVATTKITPWIGELLDLFRDNWEWSAFIYEFRARYERRYSWKPFGKPWPKLNHTERGILACVWPPKHAGSHRIQPKLSPVVLAKMKSIVTVKLQHDLHAPGAIAEEKVLDEIAQLAAAAGFSIPGKGEGKRQKVPWRAIQYLDLQYLLGRKIPDNASKLRDAIRNYEAAYEGVNWIP